MRDSEHLDGLTDHFVCATLRFPNGLSFACPANSCSAVNLRVGLRELMPALAVGLHGFADPATGVLAGSYGFEVIRIAASAVAA